MIQNTSMSRLKLTAALSHLLTRFLSFRLALVMNISSHGLSSRYWAHSNKVTDQAVWKRVSQRSLPSPSSPKLRVSPLRQSRTVSVYHGKEVEDAKAMKLEVLDVYNGVIVVLSL